MDPPMPRGDTHHCNTSRGLVYSMADFTSQISVTSELRNSYDSGAFGVVYRRTIQSSEGTMEVAVKVFKIDPERAMETIEKGIRREIKVWLRLKHPTIVSLLGTANVDSPFPALVSQWMPSGTLDVYLKEATTLTASAKVGLVKGVADGLNYLHSAKSHSRRPSSRNPRLTDFGLATVAGDPELQLNSTTAEHSFNSRWRAPEVIGIERGPERPTFKSDIYSFGGVMFFIFSGDIPWKEKNSPQICVALSNKASPARPDNIINENWNLIQKCWSWDPMNRPGAVEVIGCIALESPLVNFLETYLQLLAMCLVATCLITPCLVNLAQRWLDLTWWLITIIAWWFIICLAVCLIELILRRLIKFFRTKYSAKASLCGICRLVL
ncbi:kinase-like domain-containing protein [Suillus ampliporus]|nr:kinase-like domain-containing protein [Suillus ampliporus]